MKKILVFQWYWISCVLILFVSCLEDDDDEMKLSSAVSITSFSIENIETQVKTQTSTGKDTILTLTIEGSLYPFAIDHVNKQIYNPDSLPLGTDISKVVATIISDGYYITYGDENKYYYAEDSIDFTKPVRFTVHAYDEISSKTYYVCLNVHQVDPDSLIWQQITESNFQGANIIGEQKALAFNNHIYVFGEQENGLVLTTTLQDDGKNWTEPLYCKGFLGKPDCQSIVLYSDAFYLIAEGILYRSEDGIEWIPIESSETIDGIIAAISEGLYVLQGNKVLLGDGDGIWTEIQNVDKSVFPQKTIAIQTSLKTNSDILRTTLIGLPEENGLNHALVWSKLNKEKVWTYYNVTEQNTQICPPLKNLAVIHYDDALFAFGGESLDADNEIEAFGGIYVSRDGGITWCLAEEEVGLPEELRGFNDKFSYVVDERNFIWLMCNGSNTVFKGRINRLIAK